MLLFALFLSVQPAFSVEPPSRDGIEAAPLERNDELVELGPVELAEVQQVVNGQQAPAGQWPDAAGVVLSGGVGCTGTLIHPSLVLTAAHCLDGATVSHVLLDSTNYREQGGVLVEVASQHAYSENWWESYDIGLLVLDEPVLTVEPRIIAQGCVIEDELEEGSEVMVVGFGTYDRDGTRADGKLNEGVTYVKDPDCTDPYDGCNMEISPAGELGAGGNGVDACTGDSGGPLYLRTDHGDYLVGVTSRAYRWVDYYCGQGGIYTRPDAVLDWIEQTGAARLGQDELRLPRPEVCNLSPVVPPMKQRRVQEGRVDRFKIAIQDEDSSGHRIEILHEPKEGSAWIEDGLVVYRAPVGELGGDDFWIRIFDDEGEYEGNAVDVEVDILVVKRKLIAPLKTRGSCSTAGTPAGSVWVLLLGGLLLRRRR